VSVTGSGSRDDLYVLVTGVSGFIGTHLARRLQQAGWRVRGTGRGIRETTEDLDYVAVGELSGATDWRPALANVDTVIHLASTAHEARPREAAYYQTVIVDGTRRLAEQASVSGVRRLVYVSSTKAVAEQTTTAPLSQSTDPMPLDIYGRCKLQAEQALVSAVAQSGLEVVIVRPPLVYGPGVRGNFLSLLRLGGKGLPLPLGSVSNARSLVYVDNLCDLLEVCVVDPNAVGKALFVSDDQDVSTPDLIRMIAVLLGRKARFVPVPMAVLKTLAMVTGQQKTVQKLCGSLQVDVAETERLVDWSPSVSVQQGLARTVDWYKTRSG
jgi:UDP-glucose 4-epimerase